MDDVSFLQPYLRIYSTFSLSGRKAPHTHRTQAEMSQPTTNLLCVVTWWHRQVGPSHLDLHLMSLLSLLHLPVFVPQLSLLLLQLPPCDLPEGVDLVSLQLEVVALLSLPVQLLPDAADVFLHLPGTAGSGEASSRVAHPARGTWTDKGKEDSSSRINRINRINRSSK